MPVRIAASATARSAAKRSAGQRAGRERPPPPAQITFDVDAPLRAQEGAAADVPVLHRDKVEGVVRRDADRGVLHVHAFDLVDLQT